MEHTVGLLPAHVSQTQFLRIASRQNWVCQRAWFLQGVFDLHYLLAPDQGVSAKI